MKKAIWIVVAMMLLAALTALADDPAIPLTITSGFNADIVADGTNSAITSTTGMFDAQGNVFYDASYDTSHGNHGGALPSGSTIADAAGNQYNLAPATGNNALIVGSSGGGTLNLSYANNAALTGLLLLGTSAEGSTIVDYTLNFAGGLTSSGSVSFSDWYNPTASGTFNSLGRISLFDEFNTEQGRVFSLTAASVSIPAEYAATQLQSITLSYDTANAASFGIFPRAAILGVSAFDPVIPVVPEPTSSNLAICGAFALATAALRKFFKN
jgi:hypothetical protein